MSFHTAGVDFINNYFSFILMDSTRCYTQTASNMVVYEEKYANEDKALHLLVCRLAFASVSAHTHLSVIFR